MQNEEIEKIVSLKNMKKIEYFIEYMKNKNIKIITINDEEYPQKLKNIYDYPILLYYKGNIEILKRKKYCNYRKQRLYTIWNKYGKKNSK